MNVIRSTAEHEPNGGMCSDMFTLLCYISFECVRLLHSHCLALKLVI